MQSIAAACDQIPSRVTRYLPQVHFLDGPLGIVSVSGHARRTIVLGAEHPVDDDGVLIYRASESAYQGNRLSIDIGTFLEGTLLWIVLPIYAV